MLLHHRELQIFGESNLILRQCRHPPRLRPLVQSLSEEQSAQRSELLQLFSAFTSQALQGDANTSPSFHCLGLLYMLAKLDHRPGYQSGQGWARTTLALGRPTRWRGGEGLRTARKGATGDTSTNTVYYWVCTLGFLNLVPPLGFLNLVPVPLNLAGTSTGIRLLVP